jgi:hypothetical protein
VADDSKSASLHRIGGQAKINNVEYVEELGPKFEIAPFRALSVSKRCVLDHRNVKLAISRATKRVASQGAEAAQVWPGASGKVDGMKKANRYQSRDQNSLRDLGGWWKSPARRPDRDDRFR